MVTLQKRAIRLIAKSFYLSKPEPLFKKFRCLKFHDLVQFKIILVTYKAKINALPSGLQKYVYRM